MLFKSFCVSLLFYYVAASNDIDSCESNELRILNATESYSLPGFGSPGARKDSWTFGTGIHRMTAALGTYLVQGWWIDTSPPSNLNAKNLSFTGCANVMLNLRQDVIANGQNDNGDCSKILSKDCIAALLQSGNSTALGYAKAGPANAICGTVLQTLPKQCEKYFDQTNPLVYTAPLANPLYFPTSYNFTPCSNRGNGGSLAPFFVTNTAQISASNFSDYDKWVTRITPSLFTAWSVDNSSSIPPWSDAKLICMRTGNITAGSRIPPAVPSSTSLTKNLSREFVFFVASAVSLGLAFI